MSFWTKPIGQTLAERKGKPYYKPMFFGTTKLGYIELKSDGRITYQARLDNRTDKTKFDAADITAVSIETAEDYVARVSGGRVAGGAIVGGILLGPLGLALGAGGGALEIGRASCRERGWGRVGAGPVRGEERAGVAR